jgi:hypothetical protein
LLIRDTAILNPLFGPVLTFYKAHSRQYFDLSSIHAAFREFSIAVRVARLRMARREGEMDRYCDVCSGYNESRNCSSEWKWYRIARLKSAISPENSAERL